MEKLDGYFGFYTNADAKPEEVIAQYRGLWQVEQTRSKINEHFSSLNKQFEYVDDKSDFAFLSEGLSGCECLIHEPCVDGC